MPARTKVAHLTSVHAATDTRIVHKECETLAGAGYDVVLVAPGEACTLPYGVRFHPIAKPRNRMERMTRTVWRVFCAARQERATVYHFHDPELLFVGITLRILGARVIFDVHEDIPSDILDKPWIALPLRKPLANAAAFVLRRFERSFDAIVAATPKIAERFSRGNTIVVANFPNAEELARRPRPFAERPYTIAYIGSITTLRSIEEVVEAFASAGMGPDIRLALAGDFETPHLYRRLRRAAGWSRVDYFGHVARDRVGELMNAARAGILSFRPAPSIQDALPTKLFEYMAAGLPVIVSSTLRASAIVRQHRCGLVVNPLDPDEIAQAITLVVEQPHLAQEMGQRGQALVRERFQWTTEARKLLDLYAQVTRDSTLRKSASRGYVEFS